MIYPFFTISDVEVVCVMPDNTERTVVLEAPNDSNNPYEVEHRRLDIQNNYRDGNFNLQKGYSKFDLIFRYRYDHKFIDPRLFMVAKSIFLKVPTYMWEDSTYYETFEVILSNNFISDSSYAGLYMKTVQESPGNSIPKDGMTLEFEMKNSVEWDEFISLINWDDYVTVSGFIGNPTVLLPGVVWVKDEDEDSIEIKALNPVSFGLNISESYTFNGQHFNINFTQINNG